MKKHPVGTGVDYTRITEYLMYKTIANIVGKKTSDCMPSRKTVDICVNYKGSCVAFDVKCVQLANNHIDNSHSSTSPAKNAI